MEQNKWLNNTISRYAVEDPSHFDQQLWKEETLQYIQDEIAYRLQMDQEYMGRNDSFSGTSQRIKPLYVPLDQIANVADSISQSNPRIDTKGRIEMIISYIVSYLKNEETVNQTPEYDKTVTKYDGTYGIQRMSTGQLSIKKKKLNSIGRMF